MGKFKVFLSSVILGMTVMVTPVFAATGINVETPTQQEIIEHIKNEESILEYETEPELSAPYSPGTLTSETLQQALQTMNTIRYIAGIPDNVTLSDGYNRLAQAAVLTNYANRQLSHYPEKPEGMSDDLYNLGAQGASSSNIAWASWQKRSLSETIVAGWMNDGDRSNIDRVGHRRWILNPSMGKTGFGCVWGNGGTYSAMYAFDNSGGETPYYGVTWPAQNMPLCYFGTSFPWSISMGKYVPADVKVVLTRKEDNKRWEFSGDSEDFYIENSGYGKPGCIIFRPSEVGGYKNKDEFSVKITGTGVDVEYTVKFFAAMPVTSIKLEKNKAELVEGQSLYLSRTVAPENTDETCRWISDNEEIASVSGYGTVKGISTGTVKIRLQNSDGTIYDECEVKVDHDFSKYVETIKEENCTEPGIAEYECIGCGEKKKIEIPALGHSMYYHSQSQESCYYDGSKEYWSCYICEKYFADKEGVTELRKEDTIIPKRHDLVYVSAVEPTTTSKGNKEYWKCKKCGSLFADESARMEVTQASVIIKKLDEDNSGSNTGGKDDNSVNNNTGGKDDNSTGNNTGGKDDNSANNNTGGKDDNSANNNTGGKDDNSTGNNTGGKDDNSAGNSSGVYDDDEYDDDEYDDDYESPQRVKVSLATTKTVYSGKAIRPAVVVKDNNGRIVDPDYYKVSYYNNVKVGKASVTVTMDGKKYVGTYNMLFIINPKPVKIAKLSGLKKGFSLKWTKGAGITGYEIQYSIKKSFSAAKKLSMSASTTGRTIKYLKGKQKYYVRIRAYKNVSGVKYYSSWTETRSITTKK